MEKHYKTIVLSDIHLGSKFSKAKEVTDYLRSVNCDRLILNGDILDGWKLKHGFKHWTDDSWQFIKLLLERIERSKTEVVYVQGNHDDFLDWAIPFNLSVISFVKEYIFDSHGKRYYVTHGDVFDPVSTHMKWLAKVGDWGYTLLLDANKWYNRYRSWRGLSYYSLSQQMKHRVKKVVNRISNFREALVQLAKTKHCDGIICGHIHQAANEFYEGIHYLNSGDWIESLTALTEDEDGQWAIENYSSLACCK